VPVWAEQPARAEQQLVVQAQAVRAQQARPALAAARPHQVVMAAQVQVALGDCKKGLFARERQTTPRNREGAKLARTESRPSFPLGRARNVSGPNNKRRLRRTGPRQRA